VRGPLPESTMPPSRRSTSVNPRASDWEPDPNNTPDEGFEEEDEE
jgi:hypothetical protein